jgi:death-on-curing protein
MATEPIWIIPEAVLAIHKRQIAEHGGGSGLRDPGLLESAIAKPKNIFSYDKEKANIPGLAAAYAYGISRNHPFVDGNKRTALVISLLFLKLNHWELTCSADDLYKTFMALADGSLSETDLSTWFEQCAKPIQRNRLVASSNLARPTK